MGIGAPELLIVVSVSAIAAIATLADVLGRPDWAFTRAGTSKTQWIILPIVGLLFCGIVAIVAAVVWFASVRSQVVAAARGA